MCGFCGIVNYEKNISNDYPIIRNMTNTLSSRGPDEDGLYFDTNVNFGHKRLIVIDAENGRQPMSFNFQDNIYTIVYNGQIYNTDELRKKLLKEGFSFKGHSDTEILLKSYIHFGYDVVKNLNGIFSFAIWDSKKRELFMARDHFGIKPFFYTFKNNNFIFGSEIKALLEHPEISANVDADGICELFGIGPAHTPGLTPFKNIFELKPGYYAVFDVNGFKMDQYFKLVSAPHTDNFSETCKKINFYLNDSINKQLVSDVPLGMMLSGGLDSSIITAYASHNFKDCPEKFRTFSVDYLDNDINFKKNDFQPNSDNEFIDIMVKHFNCNHSRIILDTPELAKSLLNSMVARDMPGMADVDSSFYLFCKEIKKDVSVVLSGECSDEIFAGYPWFFREDALNSNTFPWSIAISERQKLLNPSLATKIDLKEYVDCRYNQALNQIDFIESDSADTTEKRKISYLTLNWWMQTLLDRSDRMSMASGLEVRVPFCDYRLVQYMWNVPWEMKALDGREKGLLRYVVKDLLPKEIVERKKSPYPKTFNPTYLRAVKSMLQNILNNPNAPIKQVLNENYIREILETNGNAFSRPWFGQLMTGPQLIAYLCQVNMWLERYHPNIEI